MKIKELQKRHNKALNRREILLKVKHPNNPSPSRKKLREELKEKLGENFLIQKEESRFGFSRSKVLVFSYDTEEELLKTTPDYLLQRDGLKEGE